MMAKIYITVLVGLTLGSALIFCIGNPTDKVQAYGTDIDEVSRQQIYEATVRITILAPVLDESGQPKLIEGPAGLQRELTAHDGLGTLVQTGGEVVIVTHDHWSVPIMNLDKVQFHNTSNDLLLEIDRSNLFSLLRYRDRGTMILTAPEPLAAHSSPLEMVGDNVSLQPGDILLGAYWQPDAVDSITIESFQVVSLGSHQALPAIKLKSQNGQVVRQGNSGGGIFLDGKLVGNMWGRESLVERNLADGEDIGFVSPTSLSWAALLTNDWLPE